MALSPYARDLELFVRCKSCGFALATGLRRRPDEPPPETARAHRCPRCGATRSYGSADYGRRDQLADEDVERPR